MTTPVCSVIIPSYNCRDYLPLSLGSVALQNAGPLEILVLDDGSTDGTWEYLQEAKRHIPGLTPVKGGRLGPSEGRNLLISMAQSDYCAFLDADDLWWPGKLAPQLSYLRAHPDTVLSFTDYIHFDPSGVTHGTAFGYWKPPFLQRADGGYHRIDQPLAALLATNPVGTSTVVARTRELQNANGFAKSLPSAEDWDLWLRLAEAGDVACSRAVTMAYLQRPGSLTANREARLAALSTIINRYAGHGHPAMRKALSMARARRDVACAEHMRATGRHAHAAVAHLKALMKAPGKRVARALAADVYWTLRKPTEAFKQP